MWIAEMALTLPLPLPWMLCSDGHNKCYHNPETGATTGHHPLFNRLLDMVHAHRSRSNPTALTPGATTSWRIADAFDRNQAAAQQCALNFIVERRTMQVDKQAQRRLGVSRRRKAARDEAQRQQVRAAQSVMSAQAPRAADVRARTVAFRATCRDLYADECDDYLALLNRNAEALAMADVRARLLLADIDAGSPVGDTDAERFQQDVQAAVRASCTALVETERWMGRVREEVRETTKRDGILERKRRDAKARAVPQEALAAKQTAIQIRRLKQSARRLGMLSAAALSARDAALVQGRTTHDPDCALAARVASGAYADTAATLSRNLKRTRLHQKTIEAASQAAAEAKSAATTIRTKEDDVVDVQVLTTPPDDESDEPEPNAEDDVAEPEPDAASTATRSPLFNISVMSTLSKGWAPKALFGRLQSTSPQNSAEKSFEREKSFSKTEKSASFFNF